MDTTSTPKEKSSARRNLNNSFNNNSILNYSIVDDDNVTHDIRIKLRKSKNQYQSATEQLENDEECKWLQHQNDIETLAESLEGNLHVLPDILSPSVKLQLLGRKELEPVLSKLNVVVENINCSKRLEHTDVTKIISPGKSSIQNILENSPQCTPLRRSSRKVSIRHYDERPLKRNMQSVTSASKSLKSSQCSTPKKKTCSSLKYKSEKISSTTPRKNRINSVYSLADTDEEFSDDRTSSPRKKCRSDNEDYFLLDNRTSNMTKHLTPIEKIGIETPRKDRYKRMPARYSESICRRTPSKSILKQNNNQDTPRKSVTYREHNQNGKNDYQLRTPDKIIQNTNNVKTPKSISKNTPTITARLIREGTITPSIQSRATPIKGDVTPLNKARTKLHVSYIPKALPCREKEYNNIYNFLEGKLLDGCGGCMYVSGVPGTGKTATVTDVIRKLEDKSQRNILPDFKFVSVNGMKLSEPRQSYVEILRQLTGKTVSWEHAQSTLDTQFTKPGKKSKPIILLVDELDILCTKRQDVVYNLLDWPTKASAQLIVITIANTMDLPERLLMGRVTSRLGLTRLTFQAYSHKQLQEIVTTRLIGTKAFNPDAVELVARKVASVSGDARRALDICRRSAEIAEIEGPNTLVSMSHVNEALNAMITQPKVRAIKHCSRLQQLILQAIVAEVERTGVEETTFSDIYRMFESVAAIDGFQKVSCTTTLAAVSKLGACRLLLTDQKSNDFHQKLILNVSPDDVYYALRRD